MSDTRAGGTFRFAILEYAGLATANSLDGTGTAQGTGATPSSSVTTTTNGALVVGLLSTANPRTFTAGSGYAILERMPAAPDTNLVVEDQRQAMAGPIAAPGALNSSDVWGAPVAAFRAAGSGSPGPDLTLTTTHSGNFAQGQVGATYGHQ